MLSLPDIQHYTRTWEVDTSSLPRDRASRIEKLARTVAGGPLPGADAFTYEVTIDGEVVVVGDAESLVEEIRGNGEC